jgi:membrane protein YqaA with SNARE-associated domain
LKPERELNTSFAGKVEMRKNETSSESGKFSDLLKTSWVKSAIKAGIIFTVVGLLVLFTMKFTDIGNSQLFADTKTFVLQNGLLGIFFITILAGTLLPMGSPGLVVAAALFGLPKIPLIIVATTGFTIGLLVNYALAYYLGRPYVTKRLSAPRIEEIARTWSKWGWILYTIFGLIPVLPVEVLSFVYGLFKTRLDMFVILSFVPRLIVFTLMAYFGEYMGSWMGIS